MARRLTKAKAGRDGKKRKRGRPRKSEAASGGAEGATQAPQTNVPEYLFLDNFRAFDRLVHEKDTAVGNLRAQRKLMKDQGIDLRAFDRAYKARKLDDDTRAAAYRNEDAYLKYLRCPTGTQFGFFQHEMPIDETKAEDDGYFAGKEGKSSTDNPHLINSAMGQAWQTGWLRAQEEIAQSMGDGGEALGATH